MYQNFYTEICSLSSLKKKLWKNKKKEHNWKRNLGILAQSSQNLKLTNEMYLNVTGRVRKMYTQYQ